MTKLAKIDNNDTTMVDVKDRLWGTIRDTEDRLACLDACERVLQIFELTQGAWVQDGYCYKVVEMCRAIDDKCREYLQCCTHAMTTAKIVKVQQHAWAVQSHFYDLQQKAM